VQTRTGLRCHLKMPHDHLARKRSLLTTALVGALLPKDVPERHMGEVLVAKRRRT
jgi:hypothetical protein